MKPQIDLENLFVKIGIKAIELQTRIALETPQEVEKAVIPIYAIPKSKGHQKPKVKPEQYGSGVLLKIKDQFFILSCTHIFESFNGYALQTSNGSGLIEHLSGDRFSTGKIASPFASQFDATVLHIQSDMSEELKGIAIGLENLELRNDQDNIKPIYLSCGFRVKKSNTKGNQVYSKREAFASFEVTKETYNQYNIDSIPFLITGYDNDILVDGFWKKSPIPRGFS